MRCKRKYEKKQGRKHEKAKKWAAENAKTALSSPAKELRIALKAHVSIL